ncbi:MAG: hypothetical protein SAJ12_08900 [Jaaginema sp. PMC 1079.18]|nr:hypothetical protein [Jaaginema sp. PMC 1080.18]MEC4851118.1 hypothetical protein [Jaaginema sp. PMC 1079.18]MEC4867368.1 hypothetical protein [Jaaginema sp. PMC 1078.18]
MNKFISFGMAIALLSLFPLKSKAQSFADVTGGNVWNNYAPVLGIDDLDPDLLARIAAVNRDGPVAYQACDRALVALQQNSDVTRRYARPDSPNRLPAPAVPQACLQYSQIMGEADSLRRIVADIERSRLNPAFATW